MTPQALLALQRDAGNAATARALRGRLPAAEGVAGATRAPRPAPSAPPTLRNCPRAVPPPGCPRSFPRSTRRRRSPRKAWGNAPPRAATATRPRRRAPVGRSPVDRQRARLLPSAARTAACNLRELRAAGLSTAYGLTGHEVVSTTRTVLGRSDGTVAEIREELAGRPETFYGQGRSFAVEGPEGKGWYDVTVTISRDGTDLPETFVSPEAVKAQAAAVEQARAMAALLAVSEAAMGKGKGKPRADDRDGGTGTGTGTGTEVVPRQAAQDARTAEGATIKVDTQHNTSGVVSHSSGGSSSKGVNFMAFGLAPVVPGVSARRGGHGQRTAVPVLHRLPCAEGHVRTPGAAQRQGVRRDAAPGALRRTGPAPGRGAGRPGADVQRLRVPHDAGTHRTPGAGHRRGTRATAPPARTARACGSRTRWPRSPWTTPRPPIRAAAACSTRSAPCCTPP